MDSTDSRSSSSSITLMNGEQGLNADSVSLVQHDIYKKFESLDCEQEFENVIRKCSENNENINTNFKSLSPDILNANDKQNTNDLDDKKLVANAIYISQANSSTQHNTTINENILNNSNGLLPTKKNRKNKKATRKLNQSLNNSNSSNENDPSTFFTFLLSNSL